MKQTKCVCGRFGTARSSNPGTASALVISRARSANVEYYAKIVKEKAILGCLEIPDLASKLVQKEAELCEWDRVSAEREESARG